jgi:hypothetical protein
MNLFRSAILCFFVIAGCSNHHREALYDYNEKHQYILTEDEINLLDSVQYYSFLFFINERNEQNGLVKDRSASWSPASVASIGFAIPSYAVGVERGWMSREDAASFTLAVLKFFYNSSQSSDTNVTGYKGFYYHFLKMNSGIREWNCELSTIDTGLLMMGIIFARNYYNLDIDVENQIRNLSDILVERLDWEFFKMPGNSDYANTISMGWRPEEGMHKMGWSGYNEALFLYVLAAGSGMKDAEAAYEAWLSTYKWFTPYPQLSHVAFPPIFGHIFSFCFLNPHGLKDDFMKKLFMCKGNTQLIILKVGKVMIHFAGEYLHAMDRVIATILMAMNFLHTLEEEPADQSWFTSMMEPLHHMHLFLQFCLRRKL